VPCHYLFEDFGLPYLIRYLNFQFDSVFHGSSFGGGEWDQLTFDPFHTKFDHHVSIAFFFIVLFHFL
jgi:hypothetical protein